MQITERKLSLSSQPLRILQTLFSPKERVCFFDIETTGLSPKVSSLYLIGALWFEPDTNEFHCRQWFADDYISEQDILVSFASFLSDFTTVAHYNGAGFDIPYIEKKCMALAIPSPFDGLNSFDIFREIRTLKTLFSAPNLKLNTAEKLCGFLRQDTLSGKECIEVYSTFMQKKFFRDNQRETEKQRLLLHNSDDLVGTYSCGWLLSFRQSAVFTGYDVSCDSICITYSTTVPFPFPACLEKENNISLTYEEDKIQLHLPLFHGTLYHFFPNYKDYYYLPGEDTAIHKSVGAFVEKDFRQQAKASNCYLKKEDDFVLIPFTHLENYGTTFQLHNKSKEQYLTLSEIEKQDSSFFEEILSHCRS